MKKRHRIVILTFLFAITLHLFVPGVIAHAATADNPSQAIFPSVQSLFNGQNNSKYLSQYKDNYYLDLKESGMFKSFDLNIANMFANIIFKLISYLAYLVVILVFYAFDLNIYEMFSPFLDTVTKNLKTGIFDSFALVCISLLGIFYIAKMIKNQKTQVWVAILQTVIIITLSMWFLSSPSKVLKNVDDFSKGASQSILEGTYKATNNGRTPESATLAVCNNLWVMFVHKPWQVLEFGNTELAQQHEEKILTMAAGSNERQTYINELAKDGVHFQSGWGLDRLVISILFLIIFLVMGVLIALFCAIILAYEILTVFLAMFCIFVFLMALIPWWGMRTLESWFSKLLGYSCMKIVLSFFLSVIFSFTLATYELSNKYSIIVIMIIQIIIIGAIWWKRETLLESFLQLTSNARRVYENPGNLHKSIRKDVDIESAVRDKINSRRYDNSGGNGSSRIGVSSGSSTNGFSSGNSGENSESSNGSSGNTGGIRADFGGSYERSRKASKSSGDSSESTGRTLNGTGEASKGPKSSSGGSDRQANSTTGTTGNTGEASKDNSESSNMKTPPSSQSKYSNHNNYSNNEHDEHNNYDDDKWESLFSQSNENQDLRTLIKLAEEVLEEKYDRSKADSEEKAAKFGSEPEYSYFVETVMNREKMNLPRFDEREKLAVITQIQSVIDNGGTVEDLYNNEYRDSVSKVEPKLERPKNVMVTYEGPEEIIVKNEIEIAENKETSEVLTKEFNKQFNKNYDTQFIDNLAKKYGREAVRSMLKEMKRINGEQKIENPAGYLTKSLKNNYTNGENIRSKGDGYTDEEE